MDSLARMTLLKQKNQNEHQCPGWHVINESFQLISYYNWYYTSVIEAERINLPKIN